MLACSSKRALSSTSATTCLPAWAASMSALTMGESPEVRYSVCLIANTFGSAAACSMKRCTLVENESYGWCTSTSPSRSVEKKMLFGVSRSAKAGWVAGTNGRSLSAGGRSTSYTCHSDERSSSPRHLHHIAGMYVELTQQQFEHVLGHVVGDLEAHRRAESAPCQFTFQRLQQIFVAVFLDLHVGVAGDAEDVMLDDLHAGGNNTGRKAAMSSSVGRNRTSLSPSVP